LDDVAGESPPAGPDRQGRAEARPTAPLSKRDLRTGKPSREAFARLPRRPVTLVLDSLKCGHNVGTILRLADALLVREVHICGNTLVPPNRKISAGSRGAERWVPWSYSPDATAVAARLKAEGHFVVAAETTAASVPFDDMAYRFPLCLVMGREFDGVSPGILRLADATAHLPIHGMANSINVSAAAAVLLYDIDRRLKAANCPPTTA
jgi:tRNA G18 (ribose-2'-O)-methylase SpoU